MNTDLTYGYRIRLGNVRMGHKSLNTVRREKKQISRSLRRYKIPNRTVISVFNCRFSVFFGIPNTDVGMANKLSLSLSASFFANIAISVRFFGIPTHDQPRRSVDHPARSYR